MAAETVGLREANQDFSALVERVARTGRGVTVTRRGVPIVRIVPVDEVGRGRDRSTGHALAVDDLRAAAPRPLVEDSAHRDVLGSQTYASVVKLE